MKLIDDRDRDKINSSTYLKLPPNEDYHSESGMEDRLRAVATLLGGLHGVELREPDTAIALADLVWLLNLIVFGEDPVRQACTAAKEDRRT